MSKRLSLQLLFSAAIIAILTQTACGPSGITSSSYAVVDGDKITEADLKKQMPEKYKALRSDFEEKYNESVNRLLMQAAQNKLFELAAKEKNISREEFTKQLRQKVTSPSPEQLKAKFDELTAQGRIRKGTSFEQIKPDLAAFMSSQSSDMVMRMELNRLKKKYNMKLYNPAAEKKFIVKTDNEPVINAAGAKVTIVEFTDFRCGYCRRARGTSEALLKKYGNKIRWIVKDSPFQPGAMEAHIAANCVLKLKKDQYWNYFNGVFSGGRDASAEPALTNLAVKLGVSRGDFSTCLKDPKIREEIQGDLTEGRGLGVRGTPAFFINGKRISGAQPINKFIELIDPEL